MINMKNTAMKGKGMIHHVELAKTGLGLSGGEICLLEIVKNFKRKFNQIIYVPENGEITYRRNGANVKYSILSPFWIEKVFGVSISYLLRIVYSLFKVPKFKHGKNIIISHSDFLPSTLYALFMKLKNPEAKWLAFIHMLAPSPFKGYGGEFTNKYCFPKFNLIFYNISQQIFKFLAKWKADKIIFVNPYYKKYINDNNLQKKSVIMKYGGLNNTFSTKGNINLKNKRVIYDGVFLGRFHPQKGIFDLIGIWDKIVKKHKDAKLAIIGSGEIKFTNKIKDSIKEKGLENNVFLLGYKEGETKFEILKSSKVFLFPSYFESFGIVIIEAMSCGLPVVAYDLPVYQGVFTKGMITVPIKDEDRFSKAVMSLLENDNAYKKISCEALIFSRDFSWSKFSSKVGNLIINLNKSE